MGEIAVLKTGLHSSIQDSGRRGYADLGIPESGAMDQKAFLKVNQILNNEMNAAVLEYTLLGPKLRFETATFFALTGGIVTAYLDKQALKMGVVYQAKPKQILNIGSIHKGCRGYLGISGGFLTREVYGSRSMYFPVTASMHITKGEKLPIGNSAYIPEKGARIKQDSNVSLLKKNQIAMIEVYPGPEYQMLPTSLQEKIENKVFTISKNWNRMAVQLEALIPNQLATLLTGPVIPGTVQLTSGGKLIVLMADCQVTGGYPRIVQLTEDGLHTIVQCKQGDSLQFRLINF